MLGARPLTAAAAGTASSWLIDPDEPSVIVLELRAGVDEQVAQLRGNRAFEAALPFPVRLVPSALLDWARLALWGVECQHGGSTPTC